MLRLEKIQKSLGHYALIGKNYILEGYKNLEIEYRISKLTWNNGDIDYRLDFYYQGAKILESTSYKDCALYIVLVGMLKAFKVPKIVVDDVIDSLGNTLDLI